MEELIIKFFDENLTTHTDWNGTRVETQYKCDSVGKFSERFLDFLKENGINLN